MNNSMANPEAFANAIEAMREALEENKSAMSAAAFQTSSQFLTKAEAKLADLGKSSEVRVLCKNHRILFPSLTVCCFCKQTKAADDKVNWRKQK